MTKRSLATFLTSVFLVVFFIISTISLTNASLDIPKKSGFVNDYVGVLNQPQELEDKLADFSKQTSVEIALLIVRNLQGYSPSDYAVEVGRAWGVGKKELNNGILLLISIDDHQIWISTGYGLEGAIPDLVAHKIVAEDMVPFFKQAQYQKGILAGLAKIMKLASGEFTAQDYLKAHQAPWYTNARLINFLFLWFIIIAQVLVRYLAKSKSWWLGGVLGAVIGLIIFFIFSIWFYIPIFIITGLVLDYFVSKHPPSGSGGSGIWFLGGSGRGGSSGGFGGFGGGSFGGGGGGGSW